MIEELLAENGIMPDIGDAMFGDAYDRCPAVKKSPMTLSNLSEYILSAQLSY